VFVWADSSDIVFRSTAPNQFSARATGGVRFVTAIDVGGNASAGVSLAAGGGSWATISDVAAKADLAAVDVSAVLARVVERPVYTWRYRAESSSALHMGPTAQDFRGAFALGDSERTITTVDADGVALAAIQGLNRKLENELDALRARNAALEQALGDLAAEVRAARRVVPRD
jgi:hypothetical protein